MFSIGQVLKKLVYIFLAYVNEIFPGVWRICYVIPWCPSWSFRPSCYTHGSSHQHASSRYGKGLLFLSLVKWIVLPYIVLVYISISIDCNQCLSDYYIGLLLTLNCFIIISSPYNLFSSFTQYGCMHLITEFALIFLYFLSEVLQCT